MKDLDGEAHVVSAESALPSDLDCAALVGRVFDPVVQGPCVVVVRDGELVDITRTVRTASRLFEMPDPLQTMLEAAGGTRWRLEDVLTASHAGRRDVPYLLAPIDLQVIKAAGVTFVNSMLERVIEERARGDRAAAEKIRSHLIKRIGDATTRVRPGSPEAQVVKATLQEEGLWSQYLEVGIGPDPEIFTKAPVLSAVGTGAEIGVLSRSTWNNPEPELVLVADSRGIPLGVTLGNDVNLRDFEGRSALLLGEAKDNNASCALGPFIRLFDENYSLDDARATEISLSVASAEDGYRLDGTSSVKEISRPFEELLAATCGAHHQYPDGFVLFTGTLFSPTADREEPGRGFTHRERDVVRIEADRLGALINTVTSAENAPAWTWGISALFENLASRSLVAEGTAACS